MINQWDIVSGIQAQDNTILYALLIDGTEHDARLIAKKLKGYIKSTEPALAPYVYRFELPSDLDEDTVEKIKVAVREGIEQAKKVNEFIPGGALGNPLFYQNIEREDKDFPTFLTLDPSESFFREEPKTVVPPPPPNFHSFENTASTPQSEEPLTDIDNSGYRSDPTDAPTPPDIPKEEAVPEALTAQETSRPNLEEAQGKWQNTLAKDIHLEVQAVASQTLPEGLAPDLSLDSKEEEEELPLTNKDMFNKDMEGSLMDPSLEDIFSAETKYDMFVDVKKLNTPTTDTPATEEFNIFDQKIKDQTCFMDVDDVQAITDRIPQKDLGFVQHANQPAEEIQAPQPSVPPDEKQPSKSASLPPAAFFRRFDEEPQQEQEVMDPFEQLLASSKTETPVNKKEQNTPPAAQATPQPPAVPDTNQTDRDRQSEKPEAISMPQVLTRENTMPENNEETTPILNTQDTAIKPQATPKLKQQTAEEVALPKPSVPPNMPASESAPIPEVPVLESTKIRQPLPPAGSVQEETPAQPLSPVPPIPPKPAQPKMPDPKTDKRAHVEARTILRRRLPSNTILEKTHTIDHSIELPLSELKKHNWSLEVPLIPTYTLENTMISINRFAHATAISVIDNPGKLYNPLVLHGASGTGKTHFLHAIGYELSKKYGQENIFITNGVRLSRGVQRYVMENNIQQLAEFMKTIQALLIDDIHLLAINEQNREYLSKLLKDFQAQQKQIVLTSKYPPESLAKLEELLNFRLDSGWISELKTASGSSRNRLIRKILNNNNIDVSEKDQEQFFGQSHMTLGTVVRSIRRVRVLEKLIFPGMPQANRSTAHIFDLLLANTGEDPQSLISTKDFNEVSATVLGDGEWGRIGFFYPQNHSDKMNWILFALQQRAKELGIEGGPELAVRSSYSTENIISSAFKIANLCDNKKLKGAVILGPDIVSCDPSVRENFYDILTHMLEIMLIRCGIINYEDASKPSTYVKILSELLK